MASEMMMPRRVDLLVSIISINAVLLGLRFLWVWMTLRLVLFRSGTVQRKPTIPNLRLIAVMSLSGVRGALTLAGVMTLPLAMPDGSPFAHRDLAVVIAAASILVSLAAASVGLPLLMKGVVLPPDIVRHVQEDKARNASALAAIKAIEERLGQVSPDREDAGIYAQAGARLIAFYRQRMDAHERLCGDLEQTRRTKETERELHLIALRAERSDLYRAAREGRLAEESARALVREVDLQESRFVVR